MRFFGISSCHRIINEEQKQIYTCTLLAFLSKIAPPFRKANGYRNSDKKLVHLLDTSNSAVFLSSMRCPRYTQPSCCLCSITISISPYLRDTGHNNSFDHSLRTFFSLRILHCVSKMTQLWNGIARYYMDWFRWCLAKVFRRLLSRVCMFQFSCRFACYHIIVSQTAYRK